MRTPAEFILAGLAACSNGKAGKILRACGQRPSASGRIGRAPGPKRPIGGQGIPASYRTSLGCRNLSFHPMRRHLATYRERQAIIKSRCRYQPHRLEAVSLHRQPPAGRGNPPISVSCVGAHRDIPHGCMTAYLVAFRMGKLALNYVSRPFLLVQSSARHRTKTVRCHLPLFVAQVAKRRSDSIFAHGPRRSPPWEQVSTRAGQRMQLPQ